MTTWPSIERELFARARHGMKLGLDRMERALDALGRPDRAAPAIHVAGTNGKGSVCAMVERGLREAGLRTGLYTSPHLERFSERMRVGGEEITEEALVEVWKELERRVPWALDGDEALTFFELVTLLAFTHFARSGIDVLVAEVGLGGRLDATNVLRPIVSCITPIGLDHREYLGDTVALISCEKAGIVKASIPVVTARQDDDAGPVIASVAAQLGAPLDREGQEFALVDGRYRSDGWDLENVTIGLRGPHQRSNAAVALRVLERAAGAGIPVTPEQAQRGIALAEWPGRFEILSSRPTLVLDGAHNPQGGEALAAAIRSELAGRRIHLVVGVLGDKDAGPLLDALLPLAGRVVVTAPDSPRALPAGDLATLVRTRGVEPEIVGAAPEAVRSALAVAGPDDAVVVCGSLYLVGEVRAALRGGRSGGPREQLVPTR